MGENISKCDCEEKHSVHYFMCHMTQEEFSERVNDFPITGQYKFNRIQPKRSKREDICNHEWKNVPTTEEVWCTKCGIENHEVHPELQMMRCSEHCGNTVREVQ